METADKKIKGIPYGVSNYSRIVERQHYFVDKTRYLETLEKAGDYLFFIRPRRFGKSLFISLLNYYYNISHTEKFGKLFSGTWIHEHPTKERGSYLVITFNFSSIDPRPERLEASFLNHVQNMCVNFIGEYDYLLSANPEKDFFSEKIEKSQSATDILSFLLTLCKGAPCKLYVIIDEYDSFANTILSVNGRMDYEKLSHGEGLLQSFFNVLKFGATGTEAPVRRLFMTGVSPVTMDSVTSGFNIGKNVSLHPRLNQMLGFTREDVVQLVEYYQNAGKIKQPTGQILETMTYWYGNYLFSEHDDTRLFNSDMVLYFIDNCITLGKYPKEMIDHNVRIDYQKLRHLIILDKGQPGSGQAGSAKPGTKTTNGNFSRLKEIIETGTTVSSLATAFPIHKMTAPVNFTSLLFYFGLLTIDAPYRDKVKFMIPNETAKRLYYDYISEAYRETDIFDLDLSKFSDLYTQLAYDGEWEPFFDFITGCMRESMSLRDLITGEKSIQAFLNVYLGLGNLYIIHTEKELNKGFADIVMEPLLARYEGMAFSYLLEIKYLKPANKKPTKEEKHVKQIIEQAKNQLNAYSMDKKFQKTIGKTTLIKLILIFSGHDAVYIDTAG